MAKTMEEIWETALRDWEKKHNSDVNWMKSRIDGAWRSGYTNATEQEKEIVEAAKREAYEKGYNDGFECGQHEVTTLEYQQGMDDAWEIAKRIVLMNVHERAAIFFPQAEAVTHDEPFKTYSVSDAIEKLRAYEKKGQIPGTGSVVIAEGKKRVITRNWLDDYGREAIDTLAFDGQICSYLIEDVELINESDPGILTLLEEMRKRNG